jgi:hypothetical protein
LLSVNLLVLSIGPSGGVGLLPDFWVAEYSFADSGVSAKIGRAIPGELAHAGL